MTTAENDGKHTHTPAHSYEVIGRETGAGGSQANCRRVVYLLRTRGGYNNHNMADMMCGRREYKKKREGRISRLVSSNFAMAAATFSLPAQRTERVR